jgi:hypothetical protein
MIRRDFSDEILFAGEDIHNIKCAVKSQAEKYRARVI